jgi:hypothetical protein
VGHHVERHVHLGFRHGLLHRVGHEQAQCAEGQRVEQDAELPHLVPVFQHALDLGAHPGAPLLVGGIDVPEARLATQRLDVAGDALRIGKGGLAVQVDAEDIAARPGQRAAGGRAEARRGAQHQGPAAQLYRCPAVAHDRPRDVVAPIQRSAIEAAYSSIGGGGPGSSPC